MAESYSIPEREAPIVGTTCKCGWDYPRDLYLARQRNQQGQLASEALKAVLEREPLCVFFICPHCSAEIFADIGAVKPKVITPHG